MRFSWLAFMLVVLAVALAGLIPAPAAAACPEFSTLVSTTGSHAPDAVLTAPGGRPVTSPANPHALGGPNAARPVTPRPAPRADLPSPVRTAHRVDGLSLPLLR